MSVLATQPVPRRGHQSYPDISPMPGLTLAVIRKIGRDPRVATTIIARSSYSGRGASPNWIAGESNTVHRRTRRTSLRRTQRGRSIAATDDYRDVYVEALEVWPLVAGILPTLWPAIAAFQSFRRRTNGVSTGAPPVFDSGTGAELRFW